MKNAAKVQLLMMAKVMKTDGCWEFTGYKDAQGYGRTWDGAKAALSHRVSYELFVGPIPDGMTVDHLCFNPSCVRPSHLRLLSHKQNSRNQRKAYKTHCANGHEFTEANTRIRTDRGVQSRDCRECNRLACARYQAKKRSAAA